MLKNGWYSHVCFVCVYQNIIIIETTRLRTTLYTTRETEKMRMQGYVRDRLVEASNEKESSKALVSVSISFCSCLKLLYIYIYIYLKT